MAKYQDPYEPDNSPFADNRSVMLRGKDRFKHVPVWVQRGVAQSIGWPSDLYNLIATYGVEKPFNTLAERYDSKNRVNLPKLDRSTTHGIEKYLGIEDTTPGTYSEAASEGALAGLGSGAAMSALHPVGKAMSGLPGPLGLIGKVLQIGGDIRNPVTAAVNTVTGAGGAMGTKAARDKLGTGSAEALGGLGGALAALTAIPAARRLGVMPSAMSEMLAKNKVVQDLRAYDPNLASRLESAMQTTPLKPGVKPSLAEYVTAPPLAMSGRMLEQQGMMLPPSNPLYQEALASMKAQQGRNAALAESIPAQLGKRTPEGERAMADMAKAAMESKLSPARQAARDAEIAVEANKVKLGELPRKVEAPEVQADLLPSVDAVAKSNSAAYSAAVKQRNIDFKAFEAKYGQLKADATPTDLKGVQDGLNSLFNDYKTSFGSDISKRAAPVEKEVRIRGTAEDDVGGALPEMDDIVAEVKSMDNLTAGNAVELRQRINRLYNTSTSPQEANLYERMKAEVDRAIKEASPDTFKQMKAVDAEYGPVAAKWGWTTNEAGHMTKSPMLEALQGDPNKFMSYFLKRGEAGVRPMQNLVDTVGSNPDIASAYRNQIAQDVIEGTVKDGKLVQTVNPKKLEALGGPEGLGQALEVPGAEGFKSNLYELLGSVDAQRSALAREAAKAQSTADMAIEQAKREGAQLSDAATAAKQASTEAERALQGTPLDLAAQGKTTSAVETALREPGTPWSADVGIPHLGEMAATPESLAGLKGVLGDIFQGKLVRDGKVSPENFKSFYESNKGALEPFMSAADRQIMDETYRSAVLLDSLQNVGDPELLHRLASKVETGALHMTGGIAPKLYHSLRATDLLLKPGAGTAADALKLHMLNNPDVALEALKNPLYGAAPAGPMTRYIGREAVQGLTPDVSEQPAASDPEFMNWALSAKPEEQKESAQPTHQVDPEFMDWALKQ